MKTTIVVGLCLMLAMCATTPEPQIVTKLVSVPTAVACVPDTVGDPPAYPATQSALQAAANAAERYILVVRELVLRRARDAVTEPVIVGCRNAAAH